MKRLVLAALAVCMIVAAPALAQEGHPLKGSWLGTWAGNKIHGNDVLLVMTWDGKSITGTINPGTDNMRDQERVAQPRRLARAPRGRRERQVRSAGDVRHRRQDRKPSARQPRRHRHVERQPRRHGRVQDRTSVKKVLAMAGAALVVASVSVLAHHEPSRNSTTRSHSASAASSRSSTGAIRTRMSS